MKAPWALAPVLLLTVLAVGRASTNDRGDEDAAHVSIPSLHQASEAYRRALASGRADALVDVGDLYRRIGDVVGTPAPFEARAREIYTAALSRARRQDSVDGVLRVAEAFAALGDRQTVERTLGIALSLAAHDPEARADVRAAAARIAADVAGDATDP